MGHWITLHLFNDNVFYTEVVPTLQGETGKLEPAYRQFMPSHIMDGIKHLPDEQVNVLCNNSIAAISCTSRQFDNDFRKHNEFNSIKDYEARIEYVNKNNGFHDFTSFFEYYVFLTCADFYPHIPLGKHGLNDKLTLDNNSMAGELLTAFDKGWDQTLFCCGSRGIINWMTAQEAALLYYDKHNLISDNKNFLTGFLTLLEMAFNNKLGLIMGIDMREDRLESLPDFKLTQITDWDTVSTTRLSFKKQDYPGTP